MPLVGKKRSSDGASKAAPMKKTKSGNANTETMSPDVQLFCRGKKSAIEVPKDKIVQAGAYFKEQVDHFLATSQSTTVIVLKLPFESSGVEVLVRWLLGRGLNEKDETNGHVGELEQLSEAYFVAAIIKSDAFQDAIMDAFLAVLLAHGKALTIGKVTTILLKSRVYDVRWKLAADWLAHGEFDVERSKSEDATSKQKDFNQFMIQALLKDKIDELKTPPWEHNSCRYHQHASSAACPSKRVKVEL